MRNMTLSIIMPVYNEEKRISEALKQIIDFRSKGWKKEVIVVNDGSKDNSAGIINQILKKNKTIKVISYTDNKGKGHAIRKGISAASGDFILIQDADLEYSPSDIPLLLKETKNNDAIYGSRFIAGPKSISKTNYLGNKFLSTATSVLYGQKVTDMETGYKLVRTNVLKGLDLVSDDFTIEPEITVKLLKKGFGICEVPIKYSTREKKEKKISARDGIKAFWYLLKNRF